MNLLKGHFKLNSDREGEILYDIPYMWNLKRNDTVNLLTKQKDSQTQRTNLWLPGRRMRGRDIQGIWDGHIHNAIFKMDNQLYSTGNSAQYYVAAWLRGGFGENGYMHMHD